jgi:aerobic carbon-monoxide dehydrogenase medium subunit
MDGGVISDAGIGLCAVGAEHFVSTGAEAALRGQAPSDDVIAAAAAAAAADCNPTTDQRGPAEYKRHLAGELTARALRRAIARAQGAAS